MYHARSAPLTGFAFSHTNHRFLQLRNMLPCLNPQQPQRPPSKDIDEVLMVDQVVKGQTD